MALIDSVKKALRISTDALNDEITENINAAKAELIRSGVDPEIVAAEGPLVTQAVKTYVLSRMGSDKTMIEGYQKSFEYQQDNLRKSSKGLIDPPDGGDPEDV